MSKAVSNDVESCCRSLFAAGLAVAAASLPFAASADEEIKPMLMFVQIADDLKVDPATQTIRLVKVGQQTLYFADRPERIAGHIKMADYLTEWTTKAGGDNFHNDPPNATLSVFEPGKPTDTLAVVTISNPRVEGADLVYSYKLINGTLPTAHADAALDAAQASRHAFSVAWALAWDAAQYQLLGDVRSCLGQAEAAIAVATEQIIPFYGAQGMVLAGWATVMEGDGEAGLARMRAGIDAYRSTGSVIEESHWRALLVDACLATNRVHEGLSVVRSA